VPVWDSFDGQPSLPRISVGSFPRSATGIVSLRATYCYDASGTEAKKAWRTGEGSPTRHASATLYGIGVPGPIRGRNTTPGWPASEGRSGTSETPTPAATRPMIVSIWIACWTICGEKPAREQAPYVDGPLLARCFAVL